MPSPLGFTVDVVVAVVVVVAVSPWDVVTVVSTASPVLDEHPAAISMMNAVVATNAALLPESRIRPCDDSVVVFVIVFVVATLAGVILVIVLVVATLVGVVVFVVATRVRVILVVVTVLVLVVTVVIT